MYTLHLKELSGERDFDSRLFTGFSTVSPYEILEPPFNMELTQRRIEHEIKMKIQNSLRILKDKMKKNN
jgi:hypothetical protein